MNPIIFLWNLSGKNKTKPKISYNHKDKAESKMSKNKNLGVSDIEQ